MSYVEKLLYVAFMSFTFLQWSSIFCILSKTCALFIILFCIFDIKLINARFAKEFCFMKNGVAIFDVSPIPCLHLHFETGILNDGAEQIFVFSFCD